MSDLPAGRELDALVAEKVMGWTRCDATQEFGRWVYGDPGDKWANGGCGVGKAPDSLRFREPFPCYSTDIAAAWGVVEKLERDGWGHKHFVHSHAAENPGFEWVFMSPGHGERSFSTSFVGSAPLAICLAALKAVGG